MEQGIGCSNHPDKNAIRLCDDCGMPFCAECLRKNLLGFYYCQRCYPRLFKNKSTPEYEIPRDEKGLRRIQKQVESNTDDELIYAISRRMNLREFLKIDLKRVIFFIILSYPLMISYPSMSTFFTLPPQFYLINNYYVSVVKSLYLIPALIIGCTLVAWNCMDINPGAVSSEWVYIALIITYAILLFLSYRIAILIVHIWNKIFKHFGDKAKVCELFVAAVTIFFLVVLPIIGNFFVTFDRSTRSTIGLYEVNGGGILEELRVKNNFILPVMYELPGVTACVYNSERKEIYEYQAEYKTDNDWIRKMTEPHHAECNTY